MVGRLLVVTAALGCASLVPHAEAQKGGMPNAFQYGWLGSLEQGKTEAAKTGKPLMVVVRCVP
jgi:hypothetical protein